MAPRETEIICLGCATALEHVMTDQPCSSLGLVVDKRLTMLLGCGGGTVHSSMFYFNTLPRLVCVPGADYGHASELPVLVQAFPDIHIVAHHSVVRQLAQQCGLAEASPAFVPVGERELTALTDTLSIAAVPVARRDGTRVRGIFGYVLFDTRNREPLVCFLPSVPAAAPNGDSSTEDTAGELLDEETVNLYQHLITLCRTVVIGALPQLPAESAVSSSAANNVAVVDVALSDALFAAPLHSLRGRVLVMTAPQDDPESSPSSPKSADGVANRSTTSEGKRRRLAHNNWLRHTTFAKAFRLGHVVKVTKATVDHNESSDAPDEEQPAGHSVDPGVASMDSTGSAMHSSMTQDAGHGRMSVAGIVAASMPAMRLHDVRESQREHRLPDMHANGSHIRSQYDTRQPQSNHLSVGEQMVQSAAAHRGNYAEGTPGMRNPTPHSHDRSARGHQRHIDLNSPPATAPRGAQRGSAQQRVHHSGKAHHGIGGGGGVLKKIFVYNNDEKHRDPEIVMVNSVRSLDHVKQKVGEVLRIKPIGNLYHVDGQLVRTVAMLDHLQEIIACKHGGAPYDINFLPRKLKFTKPVPDAYMDLSYA